MVREAFLSRAALHLENLALRQQLAALDRKGARPSLRMADRLFWVVLSRLWSGWREILVIVKPETVIGWHRKGFRRFGTRKSRRGMNRPRFTGERLVQILGCFFMCVQGFIEHLLCFVRRDISDGAVKTLGVVPIDPFQRFPFKLAH